MAIKNYKPTTAARRNMSVTDYTGLSKNGPEKSLLAPLGNHSGRNSYGRITVRHRGGSNRKKYRIIDFKRQKHDMPATVLSLEYDPNRSAFIALVEYEDGAVIAQLGTPDMRLPIQYALYYPKRRHLPGKRLDFYQLSSLTFEEPDFDTFWGLGLAFEAMEKGGNIPTAYNAANEKAVSLFLERKISFLQIPEIINTCMEECQFKAHPNVAEILETEAEAYALIESRW